MIFSSEKRKRTVAISMVATGGPWGGASPFVSQLAAAMWSRGWRVVYDLRAEPDAVVVIDPRNDHPAKRFGLRELEAFRASHPGVPILHRVNECDQRKGTNDIDDLLRRTSALADHTVFIAEWLRDYFVERWFDPDRAHSVIYNGADSRVFHPLGTRLPEEGETVRIVTHHWSDNWLKGYDVYQEVDRLLAAGELPGVAFRVIGRWPAEINWRATETLGPLSGRSLADKLRECHLYLTASRWEPCGMHHVEGAQCGLPLIYHEDGGGIVEAGKRYGMGFREDVGGVIRRAVADLAGLRGKLLRQMPSGERMVMEFVETLQRLMVESGRR